MKKLLALILCVMMFVSIIPTAAFADYAKVATTADSGTGYISKTEAKDATDAAKDAIETMLKGIAADQGVYGTVTAIDSVVVSLSKALFADIDSLTFKAGLLDNEEHADVSASDLEDATKAFLRNAIGDSIASYMNKRYTVWSDSDGVVDPEKYMETFAKAASDALNSTKAQRNIEALVYTVALAKFMNDIDDQRSDLADDIRDWEDGTAIWTKYGFADYTADSWSPLALIEATTVPTDDLDDVSPFSQDSWGSFVLDQIS